MTVHTLKTHPAYFRAVRDGTKTFEVRKDDRAFQCGDTVILTFADPDSLSAPWPPVFPLGHERPVDNRSDITRKIGFVLRGGQFGLEPGYVAFSLLPVDLGA